MKCVIVFSFVIALLTTVTVSLAFDGDPQDRGDTVEPYSILTDGIKLRFQQIDKEYLGRRCSVFYRRGKPDEISEIGIPGKNQRVYRNGIMIENGELSGIEKHSIDVTWFFSPGGAHGGPIPEDQIDYIIVEKK